MKVACTVWVRGKGRDNFKALPIDINDASVIPGIIQNNPLSLDTLVEIKGFSGLKGIKGCYLQFNNM